MEFKVCRKCGRELPRTDEYFQHLKKSKDGFRAQCKECIGSSFTNNKVVTVWTNNEVEILINYYNDYLNSEIKEIFLPNKTARSIEAKAKRLGLGNKSESAKERAFKKMSITKKEYFKIHAGDVKGYKHTVETRRRMSVIKKEIGKWQGSDNPRSKTPLFGKNNGRWKGGVTEVYKALRNELGQWQKDSMSKCDYKCIITQNEFDDIHHLYPFKNIIDETLNNLNMQIKSNVNEYTECEWSSICDELLRLHYLYGTGICLNKDIHKLFHNQYSYYNFSVETFLDFIYRIDCGEFDKWFIKHNMQINIDYKYIEYLESTLPFLKSAYFI